MGNVALYNSANGLINDHDDKQIDVNEMLEAYTSISHYDDVKWIIDKRYKDRNTNPSTLILNYSAFETCFLEEIKKFILRRLIRGASLNTLQGNLTSLRIFTTFISEVLGTNEIQSLKQSELSRYRDYVFLTTPGKPRTQYCKFRDIKLFFKEMEWYEKYYMMEKFDETDTKSSINDRKLIPDEVADKLDLIFQKDSIPLEYRTVYWICRLIPNRIEEVVSMKIDCLKPVSEGKHFLSIPTFKQAGQHCKGEIRQIIIEECGIQNLLLDLIIQQQKIATSLQPDIKEKDSRGYLFTYIPKNYVSSSCNYTQRKVRATISRPQTASKWFARVCRYNMILDENGKPYNLSSHMFRHNAISDRMNSGLFRLVDIVCLTGHKNLNMPEHAYWHTNNGQVREKVQTVNESVYGEKAVCFQGKIINSNDNRMETRILSKPFAHRIGKLGICADISNCKSSLFECLDCPSFLPDVNDLDYFKEQVIEWQRKLQIAKSSNNQYLIENAEYKLELHERVVKKIENALKGVEAYGA